MLPGLFNPFVVSGSLKAISASLVETHTDMLASAFTYPRTFNFGADAVDRKIILLIKIAGGSQFQYIASVTFGPSNIQPTGYYESPVFNDGDFGFCHYYAMLFDIPTGASGSFNFQFAAPATGVMDVAVYRATGDFVSKQPTIVENYSTGFRTSAPLSVAAKEGGLLLGMACGSIPGLAMSWTNMTEDTQFNNADTADGQTITVGRAQPTADGSPSSVTVTSTNTQINAIVANWR